MIRGSRQQLEGQLVELMAQHIAELLQQQDFVVLGVPGGRSVVALFEKLQERPIEWSRVHICLVDERLVARGDEESNFRLLEESFCHLPAVHLHPAITNKVEGNTAYQYTKQVNELGGHFDIMLLSSGEDGHVAALFPDHPVLSITEKEFITFSDSPKPPADRLTASLPLLMQSKIAFLLFFGEAKRAALELFLSDVPMNSCPAKLVNSCEVSYVFTDVVDV